MPEEHDSFHYLPAPHNGKCINLSLCHWLTQWTYLIAWTLASVRRSWVRKASDSLGLNFEHVIVFLQVNWRTESMTIVGPVNQTMTMITMHCTGRKWCDTAWMDGSLRDMDMKEHAYRFEFKFMSESVAEINIRHAALLFSSTSRVKTCSQA